MSGGWPAVYLLEYPGSIRATAGKLPGNVRFNAGRNRDASALKPCA
jgi:hypothetical protein